MFFASCFCIDTGESLYRYLVIHPRQRIPLEVYPRGFLCLFDPSFWGTIPAYLPSSISGPFHYLPLTSADNPIQDMLIILTSSCTRLLPSRRGYNQLPTSNPSRGRGSTRSDDENRLIDELDEAWDD